MILHVVTKFYISRYVHAQWALLTGSCCLDLHCQHDCEWGVVCGACRELHGDLNVVAVSFAWPPSSTRKAKASTLTSTSPRALRLWGYVRMVANFHRLRRS